MLISEKAQYALDRAFELADQDGLSMVILVADSENEQCEVLCNPTVMDQETAVEALEIFVDSIREARVQNSGKAAN